MGKKTIFWGMSCETGKYISWSLIGTIDGNNLYLCDEILKICNFGTTTDYNTSIVRNACLEIRNQYFSEDKREAIAIHPELGHDVFVLSRQEYEKRRRKIKEIKSPWWLRSSCIRPYQNYIHYVDGLNIHSINLNYGILGVRPAIILKKESEKWND